jgi:predicted enzyme related to lactoylglutathione lyase
MQEIHYTPGRFVWHEIVTSDVEAARRFYGELAGWQIEPVEVPGTLPYAHLTKNGQTVAGLVRRPGPHVPPHVLGYVSVLDVDGAIERAREHRAAVLVPPMQTAFGRAAVLQDQQGAVIGLCRRTQGDPTEGDRALHAGTFAWSQLNSSDADSAAAFYGKVLGWQRVPQGGVRDLSAFTQSGRSAAGLLQAPQGTFAHWLSYVTVEHIDRARTIAKQLGGVIVVEQIAFAGIGQISIIQDNVGTIVALFEAESSD